jgi:hypothetical protein
VLLVIAAVGFALLKELYGYGLPRTIWSVAIAGAGCAIWLYGRSSPSTPTVQPAHASPQTRHWSNTIALASVLAASAVAVAALAGPHVASMILSTQILRCDGEGTNSDGLNVLIKEGWLREPHIILQLDGLSRTFIITEASPTRYRATDNFKGPVGSKDRDNVADRVNIDRITGTLRWQAVHYEKGEEPEEHDSFSCYLLGVRPEFCRNWLDEKYSRVLHTYSCRAVASKS